MLYFGDNLSYVDFVEFLHISLSRYRYREDKLVKPRLNFELTQHSGIRSWLEKIVYTLTPTKLKMYISFTKCYYRTRPKLNVPTVFKWSLPVVCQNERALYWFQWDYHIATMRPRNVTEFRYSVWYIFEITWLKRARCLWISTSNG